MVHIYNESRNPFPPRHPLCYLMCIRLHYCHKSLMHNTFIHGAFIGVHVGQLLLITKIENQNIMSIQLLSNEVNNALVTKTLASGFTKVSVLNRKAYGEKFNLKGQALKKAHSVYLAETTNLASGGVAKQLASGNIRVVSSHSKPPWVQYPNQDKGSNLWARNLLIMARLPQKKRMTS